jgi:hypothetical protein
MVANPHPDHITEEMWWFVGELELLDPVDTVFAGAWGNFKPGYHCDYHTLVSTPAWRNDYSIHLAEDKVGGTWLEQYGAAVDWTSLSAQAGNFEKFKKYGTRVRAAWQAKDPRLKGWREVLCQGDSDPTADGYDFVYWTQRTPDLSHTWHMHFSCLRRYLATLDVYKAMLSILRGETLAQWLARGDDDVFFFQTEDQSAGRMNGCTYEYAPDYPTLQKWQSAWPGTPTKKIRKADLEAGVYGVNMSRLINTGPGPAPGEGVTEPQVRVIVRDELDHTKLVRDVE